MKRTTYIFGRWLGALLNGGEWLTYFLCYRKPPKDIKIDRKGKYGPGRHHRYHFIYRKNDNRKRPLMIYIHGGGFVSGLVRYRDAYCCRWAEKGFFAANIGYGYAPKAVFPTQIKECVAAVEKILDEAPKYNIDTSKILLAGESAGVYFAYYLARLGADPSYYDKLGIDFRYRDTFKVTAVISICGAADISGALDSHFPGIGLMVGCFFDKTLNEMKDARGTEAFKLLSPPVDEKVPPSVLIYATADPLKEETFKLADLLKEKGVPHVMLVADGKISAHAWAINTAYRRSRELIDESAVFLKNYFEIIP